MKNIYEYWTTFLIDGEMEEWLVNEYTEYLKDEAYYD